MPHRRPPPRAPRRDRRDRAEARAQPQADVADAGQLETLVNARLAYMVRSRLQTQIIAGDGVGENLTGLVNTAGIAHNIPAEDATDFDWTNVLNVNLSGVFWCCRSAGRRMLARGAGAIVNIASTAAQRGYAYVAAYCAAKHGLLGLPCRGHPLLREAVRARVCGFDDQGRRGRRPARGRPASPALDGALIDASVHLPIIPRILQGNHADGDDLDGDAIGETPMTFQVAPGALRALLDTRCGLTMAQTAEKLAEQYRIGQDEVDEFSVLSQRRAAEARSYAPPPPPAYRTVKEQMEAASKPALELPEPRERGY